MSENKVNDYVLSSDELKEIWAKYGKPGEIAPGTKATKKRINRQQNTEQTVDEETKKS